MLERLLENWKRTDSTLRAAILLAVFFDTVALALLVTGILR